MVRRAAATLIVASVGFVASLRAQESLAEIYEVDGVQVVHAVEPDRPVVTANVYLLGGASQLTPETAGVESLLLALSERGTAGFPGDAVREAQVATGSRFVAGARPDVSMLGFTGLAEDFDASWAILADRLMHPTLDSAALEIVRAHALAMLRIDTEDPDGAARALAESIAFTGHPYAVSVEGTEESLTRLSVAQLAEYHATQFVRSRLLVSVVGGVGRSTVEAAIRQTLAGLPQGSYSWAPPGSWAKSAPRVFVHERALPTNYILGYFAGPPRSSEEFPAFRVALHVLGAVIGSQVRDAGLSYVASAPFVDRAAPGGGIYVSTRYPEETMEVVNEAIESLQSGRIPRNIVSDFARDFYIDYVMSTETSFEWADLLANSVITTGRPPTLTEYADAYRSVSGTDIQRAVRDYAKNIQYAFVGMASEVPVELMREH